jgi:hypothetical protein
MTQIKNITALLVALFVLNNVQSQNAPFEIKLEPISISNLGGIQSYAFGQSDGKWLIVGGRLDGLHQRQPFAAFDLAGHNNQLIVVDPISLQKWSIPLTQLSPEIQEHLSATNMQFYQENDYLYCLGGYGYSAIFGDHTTFDKLTAIHIPGIINDIINNNSITAHIRQITDTKFQVTGGRLKKIDSTFYLLGGQKFIGRYNPMGPDHGPGFIQEYTDAIRKFNLNDDGVNIVITHVDEYIDNNDLHRRDYNAEQQILINGNEGITMFSGVFQPTVNLPFLNAVTVDDNSYQVENNFQQYYNHYHCPVLPIYSELDNEMHTVFFGGIAQFYDNQGVLVQDDDVPFVSTIARVTRDNLGNMAEYKLPVEMPTLLGAGAEFIPNLDFPHFHNEVFKLDSVDNDYTLIGYIYGGISSSQPNIFFINDGSQSSANNQIFEVFIRKSGTLENDELNPSSINSLNLVIYPNPNDGLLKVSFHLEKFDNATLTIHNAKGKKVEETILNGLSKGKNYFEKEVSRLKRGKSYFITIETSDQKTTHQLIMNN